MQALKRFARERGLLYHTHLAEGRAETALVRQWTGRGEAEELAAISPSDVIAQVDASAQNITVKGSGQQQFSAQIIVTGTKTVFATGAYSVLCDITVK